MPRPALALNGDTFNPKALPPGPCWLIHRRELPADFQPLRYLLLIALVAVAADLFLQSALAHIPAAYRFILCSMSLGTLVYLAVVVACHSIVWSDAHPCNASLGPVHRANQRRHAVELGRWTLKAVLAFEAAIVIPVGAMELVGRLWFSYGHCATGVLVYILGAPVASVCLVAWQKRCNESALNAPKRFRSGDSWREVCQQITTREAFRYGLACLANWLSYPDAPGGPAGRSPQVWESPFGSLAARQGLTWAILLPVFVLALSCVRPFLGLALILKPGLARTVDLNDPMSGILVFQALGETSPFAALALFLVSLALSVALLLTLALAFLLGVWLPQYAMQLAIDIQAERSWESGGRDLTAFLAISSTQDSAEDSDGPQIV